jgi:hypothetical protein
MTELDQQIRTAGIVVIAAVILGLAGAITLGVGIGIWIAR